MRTLLLDLRFGLRLLLRERVFTAVAVVTLALGIAVNTTVFSWIDGILLRPFPGAADGGELAVLEMVTPSAPNGANQVSYIDYLDYRRGLKSLSGLAVHREEVFSLGEGDSATARWGEIVSGNYFEVLGVRTVVGRTFTPAEDGGELGAHNVAVISHRLWVSRFRSDPGVVGRILRVNQRNLTVVGVLTPEFRGTMPGLAFDLWVPVTMGRELGVLDEAAFRNRASRGLYAVARLRSGLEQARAEAVALARNLERAYPSTNTGITATVLPPWQFHGGAPELLRKPLTILGAVSLLLMLIVCANVANLLLARSVARQKEFGVRLAMGAGGGRIGRQLLTETLLLAAAGAILGLAATPWTATLLPALVPAVNAPVALGFALNLRILAFVTAVCLGATLLAGVIPAALWLRTDVSRTLREGDRAGQGAAPHRTRSLLVLSEMSLACLALVGAGTFARSFQEARRIPSGFDGRNVMLARFHLTGAGYSTDDLRRFCVRLRERLQAAPGIADVTYADYAPLGSGAGPYSRIAVDGYIPDRGESMNVNRYLVAPGYFGALRIPMVEGREFLDSDGPGAPPVVIVNQTFAARYFGGGAALGRTVRLGEQAARVVGVARDGKYFDLAEGPRPHFFAPFQQRGRTGQQLYFFYRSERPFPGFRHEVAAVDPKAGALDLMPLSEWAGVTLFPQKVTASMAAAIGLISIALAAVGLYSVMAYSVSRRTREIGIRMALGAEPRMVLGGVLRRGLELTAAGLIVGMAAAFATVRVASGMLVNVTSTDPVSYGGAALVLLVTGLLASYVPARRATRVDPIRALRSE